jgi:predicted nucleotidyltransferase
MDVLASLTAAAAACFPCEPVAFAYLFGSHARASATPRSDIDVAVHLTPGTETDTFELRLRLAACLEREAGLGPIEVVVLDEAPLALAGRIRREGRLIHSADEVQRVRWESVTARMYHDFHIREERSARERLARLARGQ